MPRAQIDERIVARLLVAALETIGATMLRVYQGEPPPDEPAVPWCRLNAVDFEYDDTPDGAFGSDATPDTAVVTATVLVAVPDAATRATMYAVDTACSRVRAALRGQRFEDAGTTHVLDMVIGGATRKERGADEDHRLMLAVFTIAGRAQRNSGTTLET